MRGAPHLDPVFCGGNFDVSRWGAESSGNDSDPDLGSGIDLWRVLRIVMESAVAQPRNADSLRTACGARADSAELAVDRGDLCHCGCICCCSGSECPLWALIDKECFSAPILNRELNGSR